MSWLLLLTLGMMWAASLVPTMKKRNRTIEEFERDMDLLAETGGHDRRRWIVTPRKGVAFVGPRARAQARARERRRRVLAILLEGVLFTFLMGLVPPLRPLWYATAALLGLLGAYVWMLLAIKDRARRERGAERMQQVAVPTPARPVRERHVTEGASRTPRPAYNGLTALAVDDLVNIVVRPAREMDVVRV